MKVVSKKGHGLRGKKGKEGGIIRRKGGKRGPKAHSKSSDFGTPYVLGDF